MHSLKVDFDSLLLLFTQYSWKKIGIWTELCPLKCWDKRYLLKMNLFARVAVFRALGGGWKTKGKDNVNRFSGEFVEVYRTDQ